LEGIPLAIELAAARARVLTPAQMRAHLRHRFDLLVDRRADKDARHRSLWSTIEWSYRLLPPPLRRLFAQLSQFVGGWSLEAAQAVCGEEEMSSRFLTDGVDILLLDALERLRVEALIETREAGDEIRFRMLETLREFAAEQLSPEERRTLSARYVRYFVALAEEARPHLRGPQQGRWLDRLLQERDNLRAVFELCLEDPDGAEMGMRLLRALERFLVVHGMLTEGRALALRVLAHPGAQTPTTLRARALVTAGTLHSNQDDYETAFSLYQQSLETAQSVQDLSGEAWALDNLGTIELRRGRHAIARDYFERSLALHRTLEDTAGIAAALSHLGSAIHVQGDSRSAQKLFLESLVLHQRLGDRLHVATTLGNLGLIHDQYSEFTTAADYYRQSQTIHRELDNRLGDTAVTLNLGIIAAKLRDFVVAEQHFREALALAQELGFRRGAALALGNMGSLEEMQGRYDRACSLFLEGLAIQREIGDRNGIALTLVNLGRVHITAEDFSSGYACLTESLMLACELDLRKVTVESLEGFAELANARGQFERAIRFYSTAEAIRVSLPLPLDERLRPGRETVYTALREAATESVYAAVWAEGQDAPLADTIALALEPSARNLPSARSVCS
jgi:tetratricopeptide (TPR) repeat protein